MYPATRWNSRPESLDSALGQVEPRKLPELGGDGGCREVTLVGPLGLCDVQAPLRTSVPLTKRWSIWGWSEASSCQGCEAPGGLGTRGGLGTKSSPGCTWRQAGVLMGTPGLSDMVTALGTKPRSAQSKGRAGA